MSTPIQCEGYRRYGGAFSLGPVRWEQCTNPATVMITIEQDGKTQELPTCNVCWGEGIERGIKQLGAKPIP